MTASRDLLLTIDNGTQSIKTLVFAADGQLKAGERLPLVPYYSRQPGWAEQDPEHFWQSLCGACRKLLHNNPRLKDRIAGLAITTQRGTVINLDSRGLPLRPAIVWLDQRKTLGLPPLKGIWGRLFRLAGLRDTIAYLQSEAEANWIATYQPEVWKKTHKYLLLSGYLIYKLTGTYVDSVGSQVGYLPFDYKRLKWCADRDWRWQLLPVARDQLPELVPPGQALGEVSRRAAQETGLPAGLPIIAAAADKACEVIGSGSLEPSVGCLSYGTAATINANHHRYVEAISLLPPYPSAVPGCYTVEVQIYRGYWMVHWFKEQFGLREQQEALRKGLAAEDLLEDLVAEIPPGSMGLMLQPFWTPGLKNPGPEAKGAIIGFGDVHCRAHLYRSILEGLAYALREGKERIEQRSHTAITSIRVSGGGSQSASAMQLTADIFGMPTGRPHVFETSGLGAAIDAAVGLGMQPDFPTAVGSMTRVGDVFEPNMRNHQLYNALYHDVYKKMYRRLKPLYRRIREITGYPS
jgi:sugar (pentulose or hexulose) kinase